LEENGVGGNGKEERQLNGREWYAPQKISEKLYEMHIKRQA